MKKNLPFYLSFLVLAGFLFTGSAEASELSSRLKGKILLQVEQNGEAWYVNPDDEKRYYLGRPTDAFNLMRSLGLGISNKDFDSFSGYAPSRLSGKILLKAEDSGKAYYVNPSDLKMHYLGRPADAFQIMRAFGLGITDNDLSIIVQPKILKQICNKEENCCEINEDCKYIWYTGGCNTSEYVSKVQKKAQTEGMHIGEAPPRENVTCTCENSKCVTHN